MYNRQKSPLEFARTTEAPRWDNSPQLDERVWDEWLQKNRDKDKARFSTRLKVLRTVSAIFMLVALFWIFVK